MRWTMRGVILMLGVTPLLTACEPVPDAGGVDGPQAASVAGAEFDLLAGTNGTSAEIQALVVPPRASMPTHVVGSIPEEYAILRGLGLRPGAQALVIDVAGRYYDIIGTPQGPHLFDINSFFP